MVHCILNILKGVKLFNIKREFLNICRWLQVNKLQLNTSEIEEKSKTKLLIFDSERK